MADLTAETLSGDSAFKALNETAMDLVRRQLAQRDGTTAKDRAERIRRCRQLSATARELQRKKVREVPERLLSDVARLIGMEPAEFQALAERVRAQFRELRQNYPGIEKLNGPELVALMREATERLGNEQTIMAMLATDIDQDGTLQCQNLCNAMAAALMMLVSALFIASCAGCAFLFLIPPLFVLCLLAATADLIAQLNWVLDILDNCLNGCVEIAQG